MAKVELRLEGGTNVLVASVFYPDGAGIVRRRRGFREEVVIEGPPVKLAKVIPFPKPAPEKPLEIHIFDVDVYDEVERPKVPPPDPEPISYKIASVKSKLKKMLFEVPDRVCRSFANLVFRMSLRKLIEKYSHEIRFEDEKLRREKPTEAPPVKSTRELAKAARQRVDHVINLEMLRNGDALWADEPTMRGNLVCEVVRDGKTYVLLVHPRRPYVIAFHTQASFTAHKAYRAARHRNFRNAPRKKHPLRFYKN